MSSARSNAAARSRRAGGDMQPQQQNMTGQGNKQQQTGPVKLSISDAIGLITLRLGRVEQILQTMPVDSRDGLSDNARIVDDAVFLNMIQRIESIEKNQQALKQELLEVSKKPAPVDFSNIIEKTQEDIATLKNSLLQLNSFTMQTNQRLSDMLLKETVSVPTQPMLLSSDDQLEHKEKIEEQQEQEKEKESVVEIPGEVEETITF